MPEQNNTEPRLKGIPVLDITVTDKVRFSGGGVEVKNRIKGTVSDATGVKQVSLIERGNSNDPSTVFHTLDYFTKWSEFRRVGLPVVNAAWASSAGTLLVADVKADGSETYGKALLRSLKGEVAELDSSPRRRISIDPIFKTLMDSGGEKILTEVGKLIQLATNNKVALPFDDPFELLLHPDGTWQLITLDLWQAKIGVSEEDGVEEDLRLKSSNIRYGQRFIQDLRELRGKL